MPHKTLRALSWACSSDLGIQKCVLSHHPLAVVNNYKFSEAKQKENSHQSAWSNLRRHHCQIHWMTDLTTVSWEFRKPSSTF